MPLCTTTWSEFPKTPKTCEYTDFPHFKNQFKPRSRLLKKTWARTNPCYLGGANEDEECTSWHGKMWKWWIDTTVEICDTNTVPSWLATACTRQYSFQLNVKSHNISICQKGNPRLIWTWTIQLCQISDLEPMICSIWCQINQQNQKNSIKWRLFLCTLWNLKLQLRQTTCKNLCPISIQKKHSFR